LAASAYLAFFFRSVRRQFGCFKKQLAVSVREVGSSWYSIAAVFIIAYFMLLSFHPYREIEELALDLHVLGSASELVSLRGGFPLSFISVGEHAIVRPYDTIGQMIGVIFCDIFSCSAFLYAVRIHYIICAILSMIALSIACAKLVEKKYYLYCAVILSIIFCTQFTYFPQLSAVPVFIALIALMITDEIFTIHTYFIVLIGFFILVGLRVFASVALVSGFCFAFIFFKVLYKENFLSFKIIFTMLISTIIGYYIFFRTGVTYAISPLEMRNVHVPQLFSETRYFVTILHRLESKLALIGWPVLQSIIMSIASLLLYPVYIAKQYGIAALACLYSIAPVSIADKRDKYIFVLASIPIGAALAVIPLDIRGGSQQYVSFLGSFIAQLCFISLVAKNNLLQKTGRELLSLTSAPFQDKYPLAAKYREICLRTLVLLLVFSPIIHFSADGIDTAKRIFSRKYYKQCPHAGMVADRDLLSAFDFIRKNVRADSIIAAPDFFPDVKIEPGSDYIGTPWFISAISERRAYAEYTWGTFPDSEELFRRIGLLDSTQELGILPQELREGNIVLLVKQETMSKIQKHQRMEIIYEQNEWVVANYAGEILYVE
jgi:hypothetical protein